MSNTDIQYYDEAQRQQLLANYSAKDHLMTWQDKKNKRVDYYPAGWRLYELSLRYPTANFTSDIFHMNEERDFVIVKVRLFLGADYEMSPKKAEAFKQGRLSELDKVETKAKARACRDFGIGTELALDFDDVSEGEQATPTELHEQVTAEDVRKRCLRMGITFEKLVAKVSEKTPLSAPLNDTDCASLMRALDVLQESASSKQEAS